MTFKTRLALIIAVVLWASAFVGIRAGLQNYSPEGLALFRYLIASICMSVIYFQLPHRNQIRLREGCVLLLLGALGIGVYNIALNYGEMTMTSGVASFIISQSPMVTAITAMLFLGEQMTRRRALGLAMSTLGVLLISISEAGGLNWDKSIFYILIAMMVSAFYSLIQKPFLKKFHPIEVTTYFIWGGTLFLFGYQADLQQDLQTATFTSTLVVIYLGIFPAAIAYLAWAYVLSAIPASRAVNFLYIMPVLACLLGWICLGETVALFSLCGGLLALMGIYLVNQTYLISARAK